VFTIKAVEEKEQMAHAAARASALPEKLVLILKELEAPVHVLPPRDSSHTQRPTLSCSVCHGVEGAIVSISEYNLHWLAVPMLHVCTPHI